VAEITTLRTAIITGGFVVGGATAFAAGPFAPIVAFMGSEFLATAAATMVGGAVGGGLAGAVGSNLTGSTPRARGNHYDSAAARDFTFAVAYGNSRLFRGLDPSANNLIDVTRLENPISSSGAEEHAEQIAILTCINRGLAFADRGGYNYLYVELPPCSTCAPWLRARPENWKIFHS
jgi:hypothetical protein